MKKFVLSLFCVVLGMLMFTGCTTAVSKKFKSSISESTYGLASAMDSTFKVDYKWGKREEPYASDGITMPKTEYGVITVTSLVGKLENHTASYKINIDNKNYEGDFLVNPYDKTFVIDLKFIPNQTNEFLISVISNKKTYSYTLINELSEKDVDCNEAVQIAEHTLENVLKEKLDKEETYEVYVRLINSQNKDFKPCWYVSVYTTKNKLFAVAIDPKSKIVLARKV